MFDWFNATRPHNAPDTTPDYTGGLRLRKTVGIAIIFVLWAGAMVLTGHYSHALWHVIKGSTAQEADGEKGEVQRSERRYFFKKQPLPEPVESTVEDEPYLSDTMDDSHADSASPVDPEHENLRTRVKRAIDELDP